jgi:hypothetical protein
MSEAIPNLATAHPDLGDRFSRKTLPRDDSRAENAICSTERTIKILRHYTGSSLSASWRMPLALLLYWFEFVTRTSKADTKY